MSLAPESIKVGIDPLSKLRNALLMNALVGELMGPSLINTPDCPGVFRMRTERAKCSVVKLVIVKLAVVVLAAANVELVVLALDL